MRPMVVIPAACLIGLLTSGTVTAQDTAKPSHEVFGGFSYVVVDAGTGGLGRDDIGAIGARAQFAFYVNDWLGIAGELGYHTGEFEVLTIAIFPTPDNDVSFSQATFLFGPRFRLSGTGRFGAGAQALVGAARVSTDDLDLDETAVAIAVGVNFDLRVTDRIAWRIIQPDVLITGYGNDSQTHFRISTGLAFGF